MDSRTEKLRARTKDFAIRIIRIPTNGEEG
jgi:hypothetical protein